MDRRKLILAAALVLFAALPGAFGYVLQGNSWGAGATVTYSFDFTGGYTIDETFAGWGVKTSIDMDTVLDAGWADDMRAAFDTWAAIADITFVEVADNGANFNAAGAQGDIRIAAHIFDGAYSVLAHGYYPPPNGLTAAGDVHFDSQEPWHVGLGALGGGEIDLYSVALHELGHSIGIGHSADPTAVMFPNYWYNSGRTLSADDIAAASQIYGDADSGPTPEPEAWILMALSLVVIVTLRRHIIAAPAGASR